MMAPLLSRILLVPSHPFVTLFRGLVPHKFRPIIPQLFVRAFFTEIWSQILLDKFSVQLLFLGLELCGHLLESPTFN
jgi:hypothetical protein